MDLLRGEFCLFESQTNLGGVGEMRDDRLNRSRVSFREIRLALHPPDNQKRTVPALAKRHRDETVIASIGTDYLIVICRIAIGSVEPQALAEFDAPGRHRKRAG